MQQLNRWIAAAALAGACVGAQATVVFSTASLTGDIKVSGFGTVNLPAGTINSTNTFTVDYSNLLGDVNLQALPNGNYSVSAKGSAVFTGFGPTPIPVSVTNPTPIFSGFLGSTGLTPGNYSFTFGGPAPNVNVGFGFDIDYDGNASPEVMGALALLGFPFVNPDGAGRLTVSGTVNPFTRAASVTFSESNLTWTGFANMLALADLQGGNNGVMDGSFALRDVQVSAVPEPASLALVGLSLLGLAATRRRA